MELQVTLLIAALAVTVLVIAAYVFVLRERIRGLEQQRRRFEDGRAEREKC